MYTCYYCQEPVGPPTYHQWQENQTQLYAHQSCWKDGRNHAFVIFLPTGAMSIEHLATDTDARKACHNLSATAAFRNFKGKPVKVYP